MCKMHMTSHIRLSAVLHFVFVLLYLDFVTMYIPAFLE